VTSHALGFNEIDGLLKKQKTRVLVEDTGSRSKGDRNFPKSLDSSYAYEERETSFKYCSLLVEDGLDDSL
jgi:hypothetical protein